MHKRSIIYLLIVAGIIIAVALDWHDKPRLINRPATKKTNTQSPAAKSAQQTPSYLTDKAGSLWVVVNKGRLLPQDYTPSNLVVPNIKLNESASSENMHLRSDASAALEQMANAAAADGAHLMLASGYRSYATQVTTYNSEVKSYGQAEADTESARPGHSEHQTGLAADLAPASGNCVITDCFANTTEGKWLAANAYKYGFIIRYEENNQSQTGYRYEPWHVRYVGTYLSGKLHTTNQTLEQYFSLKIYSDYPAQSEQLSD